MEHARPPPELNMAGGPVSRADAWKRWKQQFMLFTKASGVSNETGGVQASLLVNLIGPDGFDIFQTFTFDSDADKDDVKAIIKKFDEYFGAKVNITLLRYRFFTRNQEEGESIQSYVTALRLLSKNCEFGVLQEELLKDRIVCGIRNPVVRDRLLRCDELNLDKAVKLCQAEEVSQESGRQLGMSGDGECSSTAQVHAVDRRARGRGARFHQGSAPSARRGRGGGGGGGVGARAAQRECAGCGGSATRCATRECPAQFATCFACGNSGHFSRMCRSRFVQTGNGVKKVYEIERADSCSSGSGEVEKFYIDMVLSDKNKEQWYETLFSENGCVGERFKLDSGADINVISFERFLLHGFDVQMLQTAKVKLESYTGDSIPIKGVCNLTWWHKSNQYRLVFAVADIKCQSVLGRQSCEELGLIKRINVVRLTEYSDLFKGLGCLPGKYHIVVDKSVPPVICANRKIPLGLRDRLAEELKKMEELGVIRKVSHPTQWVHPLVLVAKKNNGIRVCLDPRELNVAVRRAHYQLPSLTELATSLRGATYFSVLDANSGFWCVQLDDESADLCTFQTPFGRYQFLRLPFGINCASEVFHAKMRQFLEGLEGVDNFIDDIIVWGKTRQEHDDRLNALLKRARDINLKFNKDKCKIAVQQVTYLGHIFDANGMRPDSEKVRAIIEMPPPADIKSLERFLGVVNYLAKFIPNYSQRALPLTNLLKNENEWQWGPAEQGAFDDLKKCVCSADVLALYDVKAPVLLSVDSSRDALGAVLMQGGRPVEFASRTLKDAEVRYAQVEKELLAIVFACERFHQYVYGREKVHVESDHKPLESIFKKPLMSVPARLQRMMLRLQHYDLVVTYKPGKYMYIPDTLSRAPLPDLGSEHVHKSNSYQVQMIVNNIPISNAKLTLIKKESQRDPQFQKLAEYINMGWPDHKSQVIADLKIFWSFREELFVVDGVIFKDMSVLIPRALRLAMLNIIHEGHMGIDRCKRRARQVLFWPNMSRDIEAMVRRCPTCQECSNAPSKEPLIPIEIPMLPWEKVGSDIFEIKKKYFLILVDYYSNYVEVCNLPNISSSAVIMNIKEIFSRHGIPDTLITDNGTQYSSREFKKFVSDWDFNHVTSSPNYAQSNGKSERAVQVVKTMLKKSLISGGDFQLALLNFRNTPRDGLSSPAQLLMSRRLRCKLPVHPELLKPQAADASEHQTMLRNQLKAKERYDKHCKVLPTLNIGDDVICLEGKARNRATVVGKATTPRSYIVQNVAGGKFRRNRRHLIKCTVSDESAAAALNSKLQNQPPADQEDFKDAYDNLSYEQATESTPYDVDSKAQTKRTPLPYVAPMTRSKAKVLAERVLNQENQSGINNK